MIVLDCSVAMAWVIASERTEAVARVIALVVETGALVPGLWHLEVASAASMAERRGRLSRTDRDLGLLDMAEWRIDVDEATSRLAWSSTIRIADRYGLTLYDAAYLELADRRSLELATLDRELISAAKAIGVTLCI